MKGYADTLPAIRSLRFKGAMMELHLADGRVISVPLKKFPSIKKLSPAQRKKHHILAGVGFDFDDSDEVYHISDFLGADNSLSTIQRKIHLYPAHAGFSKVAEPVAKYKKK
jgi:hypothetical protein